MLRKTNGISDNGIVLLDVVVDIFEVEQLLVPVVVLMDWLEDELSIFSCAPSIMVMSMSMEGLKPRSSGAIGVLLETVCFIL
ncbi:MAG: hypothetical protein JSU57_00610 [Candidatus Heimdallarchaeota archaeon]|nr:MAG: hypothetical protein JSU57_00610 [Candidatus Heimdallarchaeota archaeon]